MPFHVGLDGPPNRHITGTWPHGKPDNPETGYAQTVARNLHAAIGNRSYRNVAEQCGVAHTTISAIISGERWTDLVTLARLETGLGQRLWPDT